jgi:sporulation protein YlmC with PRC-barrel domain
MIGAELIGCHVYDPSGACLGKVHDLRFAASGLAVDGSGSPAYQLTAVECGGVGLVHRLGYAGREMAGPWPLTLLLRRLVRRSVVVPWSAVARVEEHRLYIGLPAADLRPTIESRAGEEA